MKQGKIAMKETVMESFIDWFGVNWIWIRASRIMHHRSYQTQSGMWYQIHFVVHSIKIQKSKLQQSYE